MRCGCWQITGTHADHSWAWQGQAAAMQDSRQLSRGCWCEQSLQVRLGGSSSQSEKAGSAVPEWSGHGCRRSADLRALGTPARSRSSSKRRVPSGYRPRAARWGKPITPELPDGALALHPRNCAACGGVAPSLPWIGRSAPCHPAFSQVARHRKCRSYVLTPGGGAAASSPEGRWGSRGSHRSCCGCDTPTGTSPERLAGRSRRCWRTSHSAAAVSNRPEAVYGIASHGLHQRGLAPSLGCDLRPPSDLWLSSQHQIINGGRPWPARRPPVRSPDRPGHDLRLES
jgi:hypothetical protein